MGGRISSQKFYNSVQGIHDQFISGPPRLVQLNPSQKKLVKELGINLECTYIVCKDLIPYADKITSKNKTIDMALPHDEALYFDKKYILANSAEEIMDLIIYMVFHRVISNKSMGYLGRLLMALEKTIEDDIQDEKILSKKKQITATLGILKQLAIELPNNTKEKMNVIWVIEKSKCVNEWCGKDITLEQQKENIK
jgi:hypothetical protein